jgi:hypothetical protein
MTAQRSASRLAAGLWFVAALLAWTAAAVRFARRGEASWGIVAAGLLCLAMGVGAWTRAKGSRGLGE